MCQCSLNRPTVVREFRIRCVPQAAHASAWRCNSVAARMRSDFWICHQIQLVSHGREGWGEERKKDTRGKRGKMEGEK